MQSNGVLWFIEKIMYGGFYKYQNKITACMWKAGILLLWSKISVFFTKILQKINIISLI